MRIFFDTEFIEDGRTIDLISIGMVDKNGLAYYAENAECDLSRAAPWVKKNGWTTEIPARHSRNQSSNHYFTTEAQSSQSWEYLTIENSFLRALRAYATRQRRFGS